MTPMDHPTRLRHELTSSALRHVRDAEHLADATSPDYSLDQAEHLAGFAPECARKAMLSVRWADKAIGHDFGRADELALELVVALDPEAARYDVRQWAAKYPSLTAWAPECRYHPSGHADPRAAQVQTLLSDSRHAVGEAVLALWADGVLDWTEVP